MSLCGLGVDLVAIERIEKAYQAQPALAERILTPAEAAYCAFGQRGWASRLATCFAVKEAGSKALGTGIGAVSWKDVELGHTPAGAPTISFRGPAKAILDQKGGAKAHVTISHEKTMVVALVLLESP